MPEPLHEAPIPFITLPNWVKAAAECGFNIEPIFRDLGIQTDLIHLESATISQPVLEQVMEACIARAKGQHFPFVLGETFVFDYLPDLQTFVTTSPTLREATRVGDDQVLVFEGSGFAAGDRVKAVVPWSVRFPTMRGGCGGACAPRRASW